MHTQNDAERFDKFFSSIFYQNVCKPGETLKFYDMCFAEYLPQDRSSCLLDFGAGLGYLTYWLKYNGYSNITSIDLSQEQCTMAKELNGVDVKYCPDTLAYLESNPGKFNAILMSDVIEHISKPMITVYLKALHRALVPGGLLILKTENVSSPTGIYQHHMDFTHEYNFVESSLRQVLLMCNFEDIKIKGESLGFSLRPWLWWKPIVRHLYWALLRVVYEAEQPRGRRNPTIYAKSLISCCRKPQA